MHTCEKEENINKTHTKELIHENAISKSKEKLSTENVLMEEINMRE